MTWTVIVSTRGGTEHIIECFTREDAADIFNDLVTLNRLALVDAEALASLRPEEMSFARGYGPGFEQESQEFFYVNPLDISSVDMWEVE